MSALFGAGKVAVVTGASSGIGKAMAMKFAGLGMRVFLVDIDAEELALAVEEVSKLGPEKPPTGVVADVGDFKEMEALGKKVFDEAGALHVLCNNAGTGAGGGPLASMDAWRKTLDVNLFGAINGCVAMVPLMKESQEPGIIINTGSKQGITSPPGNAVYNVSKAGLKAYTEALEHDLRSSTDTLRAALLIPGWVNTSIALKTRRNQAMAKGEQFDAESVFFSEQKPQPGAWMPSQVVDFMLQELEDNKFYILCPDNDTTRALDNARMTWAMQDITQDRPPLSRWHPDYKEPFANFIQTTVTEDNKKH